MTCWKKTVFGLHSMWRVHINANIVPTAYATLLNLEHRQPFSTRQMVLLKLSELITSSWKNHLSVCVAVGVSGERNVFLMNSV